MHAAKKLIRKELQKKIKSLSTAEKENQTNQVLKKLFDLAIFKKSQRISVYLSTDDEIATKPILERIFDEGKICYVPRYDQTLMEMVKLNSIRDFEGLPLTKWKIKQPLLEEKREIATEAGGLHLIIVPGVAFTKNGDRLGHGKGFYDKYIRELRSVQNEPPYLIGLAFNEQVVDTLPIEEHDVKMDLLLYADHD